MGLAWINLIWGGVMDFDDFDYMEMRAAARYEPNLATNLGFEDWDDFNNYCDEFELGCDAD